MFKNNIILISIFFCFTFCSKIIPDQNYDKWITLNNDDIWVGWTTYNSTEWCWAKFTLPNSANEISTIIENKINYPKVFKRVESVDIINDKLVHIILDMPFPFYGRDYIVSYDQFKEKNNLLYRFKALENSTFPPHRDYVRLINAAGEWHLKPINANSTEVTYSWNGELLGDFPDYLLTRAWKTQGVEVLTWLKEALNK